MVAGGEIEMAVDSTKGSMWSEDEDEDEDELGSKES